MEPDDPREPEEAPGGVGQRAPEPPSPAARAAARRRLKDSGAVPPSIAPPRIFEAHRLSAIELGAGNLHDELELEGVHLTGAVPPATVRNLELRCAHVENAELAGMDLPRLALRDCRIGAGSLANVTVRGGIAERCAFEGVRLTGLSWQEGVLRDVSFHGCRVDLASFAATRLERARFAGCTLAQSELQDARLAAVVFEDCDLREVDLSGARLAAGCELRGCVLDGARGVERLRGARMPYPDVIGAAATFAAALGIGIIRDDEPEERAGR